MLPAPLVLAVLAALAAGACTPMHWVHPSFGPEAAGREMSDCRQQAWMEAQRQSFMYGFMGGPSYYRGRDGRIRLSPTNYMFNHQMMEMQLGDFCMRNKGFALVPVPES